MAAGLQAQTQLDLGRQGKNVDFSGAIKTKPLKSGTSLPAKCEPGEMFHKADAPAGMNIFVCGPQDTWGMVGKELPSAGMQAGRVLAAGQQSVEWKALGGDAAGTIEALRVRGLQGRSVSEAMPSEGDVLSWSGALGAWTPAPPQGQYEAGLGVAIAGRAIAVDDATVPRYSTGVGAPSGPCIPGRDWYVDLGGQQLYFCSAVNRWQGTGHTNWGMIGGNLSNQADLWSALGGKADAVHTHNAGGDVTGELSALTVSRIQNRAVSAATPADGQVLIWDAAGGQWRPGTIAGSSGWDPLDPATLVLREEFCSGGTTSGQIGALGWATSTIQGTALSNSYTIGSSVRPCELRGIGVSSTNPNDGKSLYLILSATAPFHNAASSGNWEAVFIWQYPTNASDLRSRVGLVKFDEPNVLVPSAFLGVRIDTDSAWEPTGSTFIACVCNGSSKSNCTDQDTGVSVTPDTWFKLTIWSDAAGVIRMRVNEGNVITFNNPPTLPGSTVDFQPAWIVGRTGGTGNRQASVDFFAGRVKGLAR
ncbi:MAG: hypothetical protein RMI94_08715 [Bryobacterales bacterium]|nr:hypothetical protein [Bryobacterales bacterium]